MTTSRTIRTPAKLAISRCLSLYSLRQRLIPCSIRCSVFGTVHSCGAIGTSCVHGLGVTPTCRGVTLSPEADDQAD